MFAPTTTQIKKLVWFFYNYMGKLPQGLANYLANKNKGAVNIASTPILSPMGHPMVPMSPAMLGAIKASPKGKLPPGLARYLAAKKAGKAKPKIKGKSKYNFAKAEKKLGVVNNG